MSSHFSIFSYLLLPAICLIFPVLFAAKLTEFLQNYEALDTNNQKYAKYAVQLAKLAHREKVSEQISVATLCVIMLLFLLQVSLHIELDDLDHFDNLLADAVSANSRRYSSMIADIVQDLLPNYKDHEVSKLVIT